MDANSVTDRVMNGEAFSSLHIELWEAREQGEPRHLKFRFL